MTTLPLDTGPLHAPQRKRPSVRNALRAWPMLAAALLLVHALPATAAPGTTIYRCGQTYQQVPCSGAQTLQVDDSRSPAQQQAAQRSAAADRAAADALVAERQERDKGLRQPARATGIAHAAATAEAAVAATQAPSGKSGKTGKAGKSGTGKSPSQAQDKTLYSLSDGSRKSESNEARMPAR